jgi:hypothetical protein
LDRTLHFCAGSHEQKAKNLQANPGCVLAAGANQFRAGLDVVVEGTAVLVTDSARLQRLAALWKPKLDWAFEVTDGGFRDPGGRLGLVFGVTLAKVLAFGKNPYSQSCRSTGMRCAKAQTASSRTGDSRPASGCHGRRYARR